MAQSHRTRRSTRAADRAFSEIKVTWPPPGYLGRSVQMFGRSDFSMRIPEFELRNVRRFLFALALVSLDPLVLCFNLQSRINFKNWSTLFSILVLLSNFLSGALPKLFLIWIGTRRDLVGCKTRHYRLLFYASAFAIGAMLPIATGNYFHPSYIQHLEQNGIQFGYGWVLGDFLKLLIGVGVFLVVNFFLGIYICESQIPSQRTGQFSIASIFGFTALVATTLGLISFLSSPYAPATNYAIVHTTESREVILIDVLIEIVWALFNALSACFVLLAYTRKSLGKAFAIAFCLMFHAVALYFLFHVDNLVINWQNSDPSPATYQPIATVCFQSFYTVGTLCFTLAVVKHLGLNPFVPTCRRHILDRTNHSTEVAAYGFLTCESPPTATR